MGQHLTLVEIERNRTLSSPSCQEIKPFLKLFVEVFLCIYIRKDCRIVDEKEIVLSDGMSLISIRKIIILKREL